MRIKVSVSAKEGTKFKEKLAKLRSKTEKEHWDVLDLNMVGIILLLKPRPQYRKT